MTKRTLALFRTTVRLYGVDDTGVEGSMNRPDDYQSFAELGTAIMESAGVAKMGLLAKVRAVNRNVG